jgi:uncharacterized protein YrrD
MSSASDDLRYLDPSQAAVLGMRCDGMTVRAATGRALGTLQGFIVDPAARQLRYFVVKKSGWFTDRQLLPVVDARVNVDDHAIELLGDEEDLLPMSRSTDFPALSDEDFLDAIFAARPA